MDTSFVVCRAFVEKDGLGSHSLGCFCGTEGRERDIWPAQAQVARAVSRLRLLLLSEPFAQLAQRSLQGRRVLHRVDPPLHERRVAVSRGQPTVAVVLGQGQLANAHEPEQLLRLRGAEHEAKGWLGHFVSVASSRLSLQLKRDPLGSLSQWCLNSASLALDELGEIPTSQIGL